MATQEAAIETPAAGVEKFETIVIDDGSHRPAHVIKSFAILFPMLADAGREDGVRPAVPDVGLRVRLLRAQPVVDLLRAHVEPPHVHVRVRLLELPLDESQEVAAVRGVDDEGGARIAAAAQGAYEEE